MKERGTDRQSEREREKEQKREKKRGKLEIWPQRPRYLTAAITMHYTEGVWGGTFHG